MQRKLLQEDEDDGTINEKGCIRQTRIDYEEDAKHQSLQFVRRSQNAGWKWLLESTAWPKACMNWQKNFSAIISKRYSDSYLESR